jgi:calcium-dependent protein kinase
MSYRYHINPKELGHGHYGVVRKCMDRETKEWFAIKSIRKAKVSKIEVLKREIQILKEVKHPNIIQVRLQCRTIAFMIPYLNITNPLVD